MAATLDGAYAPISQLLKVVALSTRRRGLFDQPGPDADARGVALLARRLTGLVLEPAPCIAKVGQQGKSRSQEEAMDMRR